MTFKYPEDAFINLLRSTYSHARHARRSISPSLATPPSSRRLSSLALATPRWPLKPLLVAQLARDRTEKLPRLRTRSFATIGAENDIPSNIAILGGGITGLTTAHYLARHAPDAKITLYEGSGRLGGWIDGGLEHTPDKSSKVLFQHGPRMLRTGKSSLKYDDLVFYDVVANLKIMDKIMIPKGNTNTRYLYYPDHLVKLPEGNLSLTNIVRSTLSILTEPIWDGFLSSGWNAAKYRAETRWRQSDISHAEQLAKDESIGAFFERTMGDDRFIKNVFSGMMHGIYGGDVYKLSVKQTAFSNWWRSCILPTNDGCAWVDTKDIILSYDILDGPNRFQVGKLATEALNYDTIVFEDGLLTLANSMIQDLRTWENVTIKTDCPVTSLAYDSNQVSITTANNQEQPEKYDKVISTIFSKHLAELVKYEDGHTRLPSLADTHAVTMMVINFWFPNPDLLSRNHGMGYLVPITTPNNPECFLGVLFDSDIANPNEVPGTKLTVMMGGHYWDSWKVYPSEDVAKAMAREALQRHLNIDISEPAVASATLCRDSIPQHYVGHRDRMSEAHHELLTAFEGHLTVAGPSYTTVGVQPAIRAGFDAAMRVVRGHGPPYFRHPHNENSSSFFDRLWEQIRKRNLMSEVPDHVGETGLKEFTRPDYDTYMYMYRSALHYRKWAKKSDDED